MAGSTTESFNNRQLWQTISGSGILRPQEFVEHELEKNKEKLLQGFTYYKKQSTPSAEALSKERKLKKAQHDFVIRLGQLLGLDELQSHDLFCAYLFAEYRGSRKELTHKLEHGRHAQTLLLKIVDYYNGERLYLLRCLRHILHCWLEGEHAYKDAFAKFLNKILENNLLGKKLLAQFDEVCNAPLPTKDTNGPLMNRPQVMVWALQNLKEQVELLELLLIYYKDFELDLTVFLELFSKFKRHSFGWGQSYKHLVDGQMEKLVQRIGHLEVLILLEGMDIMNATTSKNRNSLSEHVILSELNSAQYQKVDEVFSNLGSEPVHSPLLLGWAILQHTIGEVEQTNSNSRRAEGDEAGESSKAFKRSHRMGNMAVQLGVFDFFLNLVESEPFCVKSDLAFIAHYIVYAVISALLSIFQEDTIGNIETVYRLAAKLLSWVFIADSFWEASEWERSEGEGLLRLYNSAQVWFPLDFASFLQLNIALAKANQFSAKQVKSKLHVLRTYTESLDNNRAQDIHPTGEEGVFILQRNKHLYQSSDFVLKQGCKGTLIDPTVVRRKIGSADQVIRWSTPFNGWQLLMAEIQELLTQVSHGAGMVQTEQLIKVTMVMELIKEIMTSDPSSTPEFVEILGLAYQLILRFAVLSPAPVELVGYTIQCLTQAVPQFHAKVSHHLKQTGLLPFLTQNIDNFSEVFSGDGVNPGLYGRLLAGTECAQGIYPVTVAVLDLVTQLIEVTSKNKEDEHIASVLFILREVFPRYHKWRFINIAQRKSIGQKCLQLYHKIFNFVRLQERQAVTKERGPSLQESCVFSLLFTEAGCALLEIVATGVDNIQLALSQQSSLLEGSGIDLVELIEMSLSLLNRLLLLKPPSLGQSPVEQALSSQPPGRQHQHLVATIAQYIYYRHSYRLPTLATLLLKRLAMVSPMSILACLGNDAEPVRDMFLTRLQAVSEDVQLKVGILEMLSVCVECQPGLIEIFLNVQQQEETGSGQSKDSQQHGLKLGRNSCLPILLDLIEVSKQCTYECPPELLGAALDLVHSLWYGMRETPMTVLRQKESFWPSILAPLKVDLPEVHEDDDISVETFRLQAKLCSFSLRIAAMEIYAMTSAKLDANFRKALLATLSNERLIYWSKVVKKSMEKVNSNSKTLLKSYEQSIMDHPALILLLAWKNFLISSSHFKVPELQLTDSCKTQFLFDLSVGIQAQFKADQLGQVRVKLASIASALHFTLTKMWGKEFLDKQLAELGSSPRTFSSPAATIRHMTQTIRSLVAADQVLPSIHIGLFGTVTIILQLCGPRLDKLSELIKDLLPVVCSVFLQSSRQIPALLDSIDTSKEGSRDSSLQFSDNFGVHLKLQIMSCCLIVEMLHNSQDLSSSLKILQEQSILSSILTSIEAFFKAGQGISYIYSAILLLMKIADSEMGASMLVSSNVTSHLCLALTSCSTSEDSYLPRNFLSKVYSHKYSTVSWHALYCLSLHLFASGLRVLGHSFLDNALNVAGVHQERLQQSLEMARGNLSKPVLQEAEATCHFLLQLSAFPREWRFHLPDVLGKLLGTLMAMIQTYVALLIRPYYLQHMLEHHKGQDRSDSIRHTPSILQHQSSLDDVYQPTSKFMEAQCSMMRLLGKGLACIRHFTPPLPEILLDQTTDISEWEPILGLGFGTPSLDDNVEGITFGTLLNCVTVCVRILSKVDGKLSPHRGSLDDASKCQVPRSVVHFVLELSLDILMSQACRYLRDPALMPRDRQFLKRELGTELNSSLSLLQRQLRRGVSLTPPQSSLPAVATTTSGHPAPMFTTPSATSSTSSHRPTLTPQLSRSTSQTFGATHDPAYFKLVEAFVQKVLK